MACSILDEVSDVCVKTMFEKLKGNNMTNLYREAMVCNLNGHIHSHFENENIRKKKKKKFNLT